jgi:hypothetical protein
MIFDEDGRLVTITIISCNYVVKTSGARNFMIGVFTNETRYVIFATEFDSLEISELAMLL